eukprot:NODE_86_length_22075_cov_1.190253.p17 type:complete len:148 gc:universal NODE_86_length_22075_cov_1.190253:20339-20782(+)
MSQILNLTKKINSTGKRIENLIKECRDQDELFQSIGSDFLYEFKNMAAQIKEKYDFESRNDAKEEFSNIKEIFKQIETHKREIDSLCNSYQEKKRLVDDLHQTIESIKLAELQSENEVTENSIILEDLINENMKLHQMYEDCKLRNQ